MGCHVLLQGIFLPQGSIPGLLHCRWILYHLSHQVSLIEYQTRDLKQQKCIFPQFWRLEVPIEGASRVGFR